MIAPQRFYPGELGEHLRFSGERLGSERKNMWGIPHKYDDDLHAKDDGLMVAVCNQHSPWFYHLCLHFKSVCKIVYAGSIRSEVLLDFAPLVIFYSMKSLSFKNRSYLSTFYFEKSAGILPIFPSVSHIFLLSTPCSTFGWISDLRAFPARHVWWHRSVIHHSLSFGLDCWLCESKYVLYIYISSSWYYGTMYMIYIYTIVYIYIYSSIIWYYHHHSPP